MAFSCEIVLLQDDRWFQVVRGQLAGRGVCKGAPTVGPRCGGIRIMLCECRW